jgi:ATP-binding cassette subfamily B protein
VQNIAGLVQVVQQASGAIARVDELLGVPRDDTERGVAAAPLRDSIEFDDVSFSYGAGAPALRNVTLHIPAGSRFAIVGPSGSGKSTLVRLLLGIDEPAAGALRIDGVESARISRRSLRQQLAVVPQDDFLFNLSIADNIRLGRLDASDEDLRAAATGAELAGFINQLPAGLDTYAGERGGQLSGGQRQRIALARALIRQPSVLVLDEATSALDPQTEAAIHAAIGRLDRSVTVVFVTHRLASVQNADWIAVMDGGHVSEQGTHKALLAADGLYARLWQAQERRHDGNGSAESPPVGRPHSQYRSRTEPSEAETLALLLQICERAPDQSGVSEIKDAS